MVETFLQTSSPRLVESTSISNSKQLTRETLISPPQNGLHLGQKGVNQCSSTSRNVQQSISSSQQMIKRDSQLLRPTTASPTLKRHINRPKTASPTFHRHRIKVRPPHSDGKPRSKENWIPEEIRQKMLKRDLAVAMVNFEAKETCNTSIKHITQRSNDTLERSLCKEKFGIEQRKPCGLCCRKFLPVNLVLAVPLKAVLDIRDSWGDKFDPEGTKRVHVNPNLRKAPACYNSTKVCAFCAQLFDQQQETYRPSFEAKEAEKERLKSLEEAARKKVENDPLSQIDKERDAEVDELTKSLFGQHDAISKVTKAKSSSRRLSTESNQQ